MRKPIQRRPLWQTRTMHAALSVLLLGVAGFAGQVHAAESLAQVDRALAALASAQDLRSASAVLQRVRPSTSGSDVADAYASRETIATALDSVRDETRGPGLELAQAGLLADVLALLDNLARVESQRGIANAVPELKDALWRRYVTPALAGAAAKTPLAPPLTGRLAGQWIDGRKSSVRVFDLWADAKTQALAWARDEFATAMPDPDRVLARDLIEPSEGKGAKLALYLDLAGLPQSERDKSREVRAAGGAPNLRYVLDDTGRRMEACLADAPSAQVPDPGGSVAKKGARPDKTASAPLPPNTIRVGPEASDEAEAGCRRKVAPAELAGRAILFDPVRRIRVLESKVGEGGMPLARVLARSAAFAKVWP